MLLFLAHFPFLFPAFPFFSSSLFPPLFSLVPMRVTVVFLDEPTCPPAHQTHPRWASVLNSKLKTHYRAISLLIMLSNDLISLSVSPVSHQRACQHPPLVSEGPGCSQASPPPPLSQSSSKTGYTAHSLQTCQGKVTGDTGGKRLWNESAGYFIYHIHSISQSGTVNQGPF